MRDHKEISIPLIGKDVLGWESRTIYISLHIKSKSFKSNLEQGVQEKLCSIKNFKNIVLNPPPDSETEKFFKCRGIAFWFFRILTLQILEDFFPNSNSVNRLD